MMTQAEVLIQPPFYITNPQSISATEMSATQDNLIAVLHDLESDRSRDTFIRTEEFNQSWSHIQSKDRELIIDLLTRSSVAEYSGFLMYKRLSYQLKETNSNLARGFSLLARDEARHAAFLNQALADFQIKPTLGFLTKNIKYTFIPFSYFIYTTYLSEKTSSNYYLTIFNHLEAHPKYSIYPLFKFYKTWSEDENRHGDMVAAIIKSQPKLLRGWQAKLACKVALILNFSMMYLNSRNRINFYKLLGIDTHQHNIIAIKKINNTISQDLPITLDVENPRFWASLDNCLVHIKANENIDLSKHNSIWKLIRKIPHYLALITSFLNLLFIKSRHQA